MSAEGFYFQPDGNTAGGGQQFPDMPEIGHPESYYADRVHEADRNGNIHAHEAYKVGQYVTLAMDPTLTWEEKLKYFSHALKRHCQPPRFPNDELWLFYRNLADLVCSHCGHEALRLASREDDSYADRQQRGEARDVIDDDAEIFFRRLLGTQARCPEWFSEEDWAQLLLIRDQWI